MFFADSNEDLRDDVIIGVQYVSGAGPQGMIPYTEVRIYEDSGNSNFAYNRALSHEINTNLPVDVTAEYHKDGVGIYPYFAIGEWVHLCIIPVTQEIIDDYAQKGVEIREIE